MNTISKHMIIIIYVFFTSLGSFAINSELAIDSANSNYKNGNYENAIKYYESILSQGYESASIYYNLGNAYFRIKDIPKSILNFERAKLLSPKDDDINFNLNLTSGLIVDKVNNIPEFIVTAWFKNILNMFSVNIWAAISLVLFVLSLLIILFFLFSKRAYLRKLFFWTGSLIFIISLICLFIAVESRVTIIDNHSAIVMQVVITAKSSPSDSSTDLFIIHEGTKVTINEKLDDWNEIKLSDGNVGWVKSKDIEEI